MKKVQKKIVVSIGIVLIVVVCGFLAYLINDKNESTSSEKDLKNEAMESEIKKVSRRISTKISNGNKPAQVITENVNGIEIIQKALSGDDIAKAAEPIQIKKMEEEDQKNLPEVQYDYKELVKDDIGDYKVQGAITLGDKNLLNLCNWDEGDKLIAVERDGSITNEITYTATSKQYYIQDMILYENYLYLSVYDAIPNIGGVYRTCEANQHFKTFYEDAAGPETTELTRLQHTALLFQCDPNTGVPLKFYAVSGAFGAELEVRENGNLVWNVERIIKATPSAMSSNSNSAGGKTLIYQYALNEKGEIQEEVKTDNIRFFER